MSEWVWSVGGMVLTGEQKCWEWHLSQCHGDNHNLAWSGVGSNPRLCGENSASDGLKRIK